MRKELGRFVAFTAVTGLWLCLMWLPEKPSSAHPRGNEYTQDADGGKWYFYDGDRLLQVNRWVSRDRLVRISPPPQEGWTSFTMEIRGELAAIRGEIVEMRKELRLLSDRFPPPAPIVIEIDKRLLPPEKENAR